MFVPKLNLIFIHVPKTGGSSIKRAINSNLPTTNYGMRNHSIYRHYEEYCNRNHRSIRAYTIVSCVRCPYSMLWSKYNHMCIKQQKWWTDGERSQYLYLNPDTGEYVATYDKFCALVNDYHAEYITIRAKDRSRQCATMLNNIVTDSRIRTYKELFIPQKYFLCDSSGNLHVDELLHTETLSLEWPRVAQKYGFASMVVKNKGSHRSSTYASNIDMHVTIRDKIYEIFLEDFRMFGYSK